MGDDASAARVPPAVRQRQQVDRRESVQRRVLHPEGAGRAEGQDRAAAAQRHGVGRTRSIRDYQVGDGCLVDQLVGQYLADVAGLGDLLDGREYPQDAGIDLRYNYKRTPAPSTNRCSGPMR